MCLCVCLLCGCGLMRLPGLLSGDTRCVCLSERGSASVCDLLELMASSGVGTTTDDDDVIMVSGNLTRRDDVRDLSAYFPRCVRGQFCVFQWVGAVLASSAEHLPLSPLLPGLALLLMFSAFSSWPPLRPLYLASACEYCGAVRICPAGRRGKRTPDSNGSFPLACRHPMAWRQA